MSLQGILNLPKQSRLTPHAHNYLFGFLLPKLQPRERWHEAREEIHVGQAWLEEEFLTKQQLDSRNIIHIKTVSKNSSVEKVAGGRDFNDILI